MKNGTEKGKQVLLDEFTRLTGCHRKSAVRFLAALVYSNGRPVKLKPEKKRPAGRKGKRVYTDEVIRSVPRQGTRSSPHAPLFLPVAYFFNL